METLILGWYVLVETGSVVLLTVFGALQYGGTLIAPIDRRGERPHRAPQPADRHARDLRAVATTLMTLAFAGTARR